MARMRSGSIVQSDGSCRLVFPVEKADIDLNGHVNNVVYVEWMQRAAVAHSDAVGGTRAMEANGGAWVARRHEIDYRRPAFLKDEIIALTWVADMGRARSLRKYAFYRSTDSALLASGRTDWVYLDRASQRPRSIPEEVRACFRIPDREPDPNRCC
jgi:acyl-CoA thioester hydrolase